MNYRSANRRRAGTPHSVVRLAVLLALAGLLSVAPRPVAAHAYLSESDPAASTVWPTAPAEVTLRFTETLEQGYSRADLYDQTGAELDGASFRFGSDGSSLIVSLPEGLANGTYSVLWRALSTADGHTAQGYVPFTVGIDRDVAAAVPLAVEHVATAEHDSAGAPEIVRAASRWFALLALAAVVAIWPVWLFVLRPAVSPAWQAGPALARRARRFAAWAIGLAFLANVVALVVQALAALAEGGFLGALATTLFETQYGTVWLVRVGLLLLFAAALLGVGWWWPWRHRVPAFVALTLAALLPLPFSLLSHAAAQPEGRATAIASDMAHLLGAALWVGGIFVLLATLAPALNDLTAAGRQVVLGQALPRFSALALVAWGVMLLTGVYAALLQVGNVRGLVETAYGQSLLLKLALLVPLLALAAFNLLVVTRKIRRAADEEATAGWSGNFVTALAAEAVLVTLLLGVVGMMIGQAPAREEQTAQAGQMTIPFDANGQQGTLSITPGSVGPNHYRLELGGGHEAHVRNPVGTEALLRFDLPEQGTGQAEVPLLPAADGTFEGHGSELSIAGDWTLGLLVTGPGQPDWEARTERTVGLEPPTADLPPPPPRFGPVGIAALLLLILGVAGVVWAAMAKQSAVRREAAGLGVAALVLGGLVLLGARLPPVPAPEAFRTVPRPEPAAMTRGEGGRARGIGNGISGGVASGFGDAPGDQEIADLVASYEGDLR